MAYQIDHQSSRIRALSENTSLPPFIPPSSPSTKRKRDVLLFITPVSSNTSFASSTGGSFTGEGAGDSLEGANTAGGAIGDVEGGVVGEGKNAIPVAEELKDEGVEIPSPRTKVANKLEGLALSGDKQKKDVPVEDVTPPSKSAKAIKSWRKSAVGRFTGYPGPTSTTFNLNAEEAMAVDNNEDEHELARTPKKKKQNFSEATDTIFISSVNDPQATPKKGKPKVKAAFAEPSEIEMSTAEEYSARPEDGSKADASSPPSGDEDGVVVFGGSSTQAQTPSRRKLRSPPPSIAEDDENPTQRTGEDEDEDSEPETGIGFKPTALQREIRNQKRMQQIKEYKARESREARAKRTTERRRRNVTERGASATSSTSSLLINATGEEPDEMVDVQKSTPLKKVHFETS